MSKSNTIKIILLGNQAVGKTSLLEQYVNTSYKPRYRATLGANFLTKKVCIDNVKYALQIWDTAGQELFRSLGTGFYRGSDGCVLVFDVTSTKTFESLESWKDEFLFQVGQNSEFPFLVIGNKVDLIDNRVVSTLKAQKWCDENNLHYLECSAKNGNNVSEAFTNLIRKILENNLKNQFDFNPIVKLEKKKKKKKRKIKC